MLKDMFRKISSLFTALMMCMTIVSALPQSVIRVYAEQSASDISLDEPGTSKTLTSNGDGTYDLSLSATGSSQKSVENSKADVIIIFDTSGSMNYDEKGEEENGMRMKAAKTATNKLVDSLLKNNTASAPDNIKISLITFATDAHIKIENSTSASKIKGAIDDLSADGGTNWEAALNKASSITTRDGAECTVTANAETDWNFTFENVYRYVNAREVQYTVVEEEVEGYRSSVTGDSVNGFTLTNIHDPWMIEKIHGIKVWNDNNNASSTRPDSIILTLLADGEKVAETTASQDLEWFFSFEKLPVYKDGEKIAYTLVETEVEGYRASYGGSSDTGFTVCNTLRPQTPVTLEIKPRPQTPATPDTSDHTDLAMNADLYSRHSSSSAVFSYCAEETENNHSYNRDCGRHDPCFLIAGTV